MTSDYPTTREEAVEAMRALQETYSQDELVGPIGLIDGKHLQRSIGVSAFPPDFSDHYVHMVVPKAITISHIPNKVNGVAIVIQHEDLPGAIAV
jgi:hypothetical protein